MFKTYRNNIRPSNENEIIEMLLKFWYEDNKIRKNTIMKIFKHKNWWKSQKWNRKYIRRILRSKWILEENQKHSDIIEMNKYNDNRLNKIISKIITEWSTNNIY